MGDFYPTPTIPGVGTVYPGVVGTLNGTYGKLSGPNTWTGTQDLTGATVSQTFADRIIAEAHTDTVVTNTTTETTLAQFALPTNLVTGEVLEFEAEGDLINNSGGSVNLQWRVYVGSTAVLASISGGLSASASRRKWTTKVRIRVAGASAQRISGRFNASAAQGASWADGSYSYDGYGTAAEDLTSAKNVTVTVQWGTASTLADVTVHGAHLRRLGKAF